MKAVLAEAGRARSSLPVTARGKRASGAEGPTLTGPSIEIFLGRRAVHDMFFRLKLQMSEAIGVDKTLARTAAARNGFRPSGKAGKIFRRDLPQVIEKAQ